MLHSSLEKATFESEGARRIAFSGETYTYCEQNVYVLELGALPLARRGFAEEEKTQLTLPPYKVSDGSKDNLLKTP